MLPEPVAPYPGELLQVSFSRPESKGQAGFALAPRPTLLPGPHPPGQHDQGIWVVLWETQRSPRLHNVIQMLEHWLGDP